MKAKRYFIGCAKQTTGIAGINVGQLKKVPVLLPPPTLQTQFASFVTQVDKSKSAVQKTLEKLQLLRKSLMQNCLDNAQLKQLHQVLEQLFFVVGG